MRNHLVEMRKGLTHGAAMVLCAGMAEIDEALAKAQRAITSAKNALNDTEYAIGNMRLDRKEGAAEMERARIVLAGRSEPPSPAEIAVHHAAGGKWRVVEHEHERILFGRRHKHAATERTLREPEYIAAYKAEVEERQIQTTWWALDKGYLLTTWPEAEVGATPPCRGHFATVDDLIQIEKGARMPR